MTHTHANVTALKTLLPEIHNHLHLIDPIRSCLGSLPSSLPDDYRPPAESPWEKWEQCERWWIARYRMDLVAGALLALAEGRLSPFHARTMALCVYYGYIEPWSAFRAPGRDRHVTKGVLLMAESIPLELTAYQPLYVNQPKPREAKRLQIAEMLRDGYGYRHIVRELECSRELISDVAKLVR